MLYLAMALGFGMLVLIPLVAIITEYKAKVAGLQRRGDSEETQKLIERVDRLQALVVQQQTQIEQLRDLVHESVLKIDDATEVQQRILPGG